jgi:phage terminase large subunit GpA-like protein
MVSTPTIRGLSRIEREFEASDQRRYFVPCPHCGAMQWLQFERLRWNKGRPDTAAYHCEGCEKPIAEHHKTQMLERGEWRATAVSADPHSIGFHISALYSPLGWKSWQQIAREWLAAQGSEAMLRVARNTLLGETWVESGEAPEWQRLAERRESYAGAQVPVGGLFLTAGVDVQKDRIEVDVWAWGRGLGSWLVDHIVIAGGPDYPACWDKLTALLGRTPSTTTSPNLASRKSRSISCSELLALSSKARCARFCGQSKTTSSAKACRTCMPSSAGNSSTS